MDNVNKNKFEQKAKSRIEGQLEKLNQQIDNLRPEEEMMVCLEDNTPLVETPVLDFEQFLAAEVTELGGGNVSPDMNSMDGQ